MHVDALTGGKIACPTKKEKSTVAGGVLQNPGFLSHDRLTLQCVPLESKRISLSVAASAKGIRASSGRHSASSVIIGIGLIIFGASLLGIAALFKIGRDDGGPLFIVGWIVSSVAGLLCFLWVLWGKLRRGLTH